MPLGLSASASKSYQWSSGNGISVSPLIVPGRDFAEMIVDAAQPSVIPGFGDVIDMYVRGIIGEGEAKCLIQLNGGVWDLWNTVASSQHILLSPDDAIEWVRRNDLPMSIVYDSLRWVGIVDSDIQEAIRGLYDQLPTVSDILHFQQRNVHDTKYVQDFRLMQDFEEKFWPRYGKQLRAQGILKTTAEDHYAAHWVNPAPQQLLEMVYRLREGNPTSPLIFTPTDYERVLAEQDVAPYFRERFNAIKYQVPAISYIKEMYRQDVITADTLKGIHQDLGYSAQISDAFVKIDDIQKRRIRAQQTHGWTTKTANDAWLIGTIDDGQHTTIFEVLEYTPEEAQAAREASRVEFNKQVFVRARSRALSTTIVAIRKGIRVGTIQQIDAIELLQAAGWPEEYAVSLAQQERIDADTDHVKEVVTAIRKAYLRGEIDENAAIQSLQSIGIYSDQIDRYIALWKIQNTPNRKRRTAQQITNDIAGGLMSAEEGLARLIALGYSQPDSMLFLADAQGKQAQRAARESSRQAHIRKSRDLQIAAEVRSVRRQERELVAKLRMLTPPNKLQKWAALGEVGRARFFSLMRAMGYDDLDIQRWWTEACAKKSAKCAETGTLDNGSQASGTSQGGHGGGPTSPP
jgi:hypothetical protein